MRLTVYTERGNFTGLPVTRDERTLEEWKKQLNGAAKGEQDCLMLDTARGFVVLGRELLQSAAFVVED